MKYEVFISYKDNNGCCKCNKEMFKLCICKTIAECNQKLDAERNNIFRLNDIGYSEIHKVTRKGYEVLHKTIYCSR